MLKPSRAAEFAPYAPEKKKTLQADQAPCPGRPWVHRVPFSSSRETRRHWGVTEFRMNSYSSSV